MPNSSKCSGEKKEKRFNYIVNFVQKAAAKGTPEREIGGLIPRQSILDAMVKFH